MCILIREPREWIRHNLCWAGKPEVRNSAGEMIFLFFDTCRPGRGTVKGVGREFYHSVFIVPRLRTIGTIVLLSLHAYMARKKNLYFLYFCVYIHIQTVHFLRKVTGKILHLCCYNVVDEV